jgi:hypothetical protein
LKNTNAESIAKFTSCLFPHIYHKFKDEDTNDEEPAAKKSKGASAPVANKSKGASAKNISPTVVNRNKKLPTVSSTVISRIGKTKDSIDKDALKKNSLEKGSLEKAPLSKNCRKEPPPKKSPKTKGQHHLRT